ncbi:MAG: hypothetical protein ABSA39_16545 [Edaphobacter sp.]
MNKGIGGATTVGALLLAGLMLQPRGPVSSRDAGSDKAPETEPAKAKASDGPWQASCNYWAAVGNTVQNSASSPDVTIAEKDGVKLQLKSGGEQAGCSSDNWGLPSGGETAEISTIIATVPDPIHSHLALDFDRAIDAILLAAADNHYLGSYYWLPWRSQISTSSSGDSTANAVRSTGADIARERMPGLIILRYAPEVSEWKGEKTNDFERITYQRVIYLFLVGETPSLGINGNQLQNAFSYEERLKDDASVKSTLSVCWPRRGDRRCEDAVNQLSIVGPIYSGSAASLNAGIKAALPNLGNPKVSITGVTATEIAVRELDSGGVGQYRSFGEDVAFEQERFLCSLAETGYHLNRVAVLSEAGTVFGGNTDAKTALRGCSLGSDLEDERILSLRFPRELSLLRNAQANQMSKPDASAPPTPYLNLSLKDYAADDTVPRFSTNQSPLSIEAQLMAVAHQLQRARSQFIVISASNVLDDIFLAEFLHRACPDARLVILSGGDLLFERDVEDESYIGSISISPYLLSSLDFGNRVQWLHADFQAEEIYNAASFTFWNNGSEEPPTLAGYRNYPVADPHHKSNTTPKVQFQQIPMWAAVIGADGYYPLAVLNWCGSNLPAILPTIVRDGRSLMTRQCKPEQATKPSGDSPEPQNVWNYVPESINQNSGISPALLWGIITGFILLACIAHIAFLWSADLWSPVTRDLAIEHNDLPRRRSVYLNIGTSVLIAMAFVTSFPLILVGKFFPLATVGHVLAWATIVVACAAGLLTMFKTWRYCYHRHCPEYTFFNLLAAVALTTTILFWMGICTSNNLDGNHSFVGLYFSYRCLRPLSGVCPLLPILLLLFAWYLWSIYQTARLRFSEIHRPRLARLRSRRDRELGAPAAPYLPDHTAYPLFVPDEALDNCDRSTDICLYENMMCLLISRQVIYRLCAKLATDTREPVRRVARWVRKYIDPLLFATYVVLFAMCAFAIHIHSIERFLLPSLFVAGFPTRYELLIMALFFPLIMVALSGWLRFILVWGALSRGLLEPLERLPIRFAFTRFKGGSWMSMLRQKGLHIRWRDMGRSTESIRQLVHHPDLKKTPALHAQLSEQNEVINARIYELMQSIKAAGAPVPDSAAATPAPAPVVSESMTKALLRAKEMEDSCDSKLLWDLPKASADLCSIYHIEQGYAEFCRRLIDGLLIPYWDEERTGHVEETSVGPAESDKSKEQKPTEPTLLQLAEELIVVRYVALIRAVLINIRYLMLLVSTAFVLALVAWNSYPFQPHAFIDWCFTILLGCLTLGFVWVFAQMHRNAILSRITDTTANELGWEFYLRLVTFGAVPVLTWLAYQFPAIGGSLYKIIQPGLQVVK